MNTCVFSLLELRGKKGLWSGYIIEEKSFLLLPKKANTILHSGFSTLIVQMLELTNQVIFIYLFFWLHSLPINLRMTGVFVQSDPAVDHLFAFSHTGTTERVCLIQGTVEALNGVHNFIAEKVREMPQSAQKPEPVSILQPQTTVNPDRVKQVRRCPVTSRWYHSPLRFSGWNHWHE